VLRYLLRYSYGGQEGHALPRGRKCG
jgi:hypothetical protein